MSRKKRKKKKKFFSSKCQKFGVQPSQSRQNFMVDPNKIIDILRLKPYERVVSKDTPGVSPLKEVVLPKEGGIESYLEGEKQPYPGYPDYTTVYAIEAVKRTLRTLIESLAVMMKKHRVLKFILLARDIKRLVPKWLKLGFYIIMRHRLKPKVYSHAVREIYRVLNIAIERDSRPEMKEKFVQARDLICVILEFDDAYRFIFQDIFSELNLDEIKLDEKDLHYALKMEDYDFGGRRKNDQNRDNTSTN